ncbi:MAG TPA: zf-HC2 domain-containing protein [Burkholderiaceae bacterium]
MSGRVVQFGDVHQRVQALLPWYVGASLGAEERARVDAHLAECARCQAELAWERRLHVADDDTDVPADVERDLALLRERIADRAAPAQPGGAAARLLGSWRQGPAWMRWAVAGHCAVVAMLGLSLLLVALSPEPRYRALGARAAAPGAAGGGNLIVRFRPDATEQDMRSALRDSQARLVYGPTTTDAYLLAVPADRVKAAVTRLRGERAVLLVESLDGGAVP